MSKVKKKEDKTNKETADTSIRIQFSQTYGGVSTETDIAMADYNRQMLLDSVPPAPAVK